METPTETGITEKQFCTLAKKHTVIPLCLENVVSDSINPLQAFGSLLENNHDAFLLESVEGEEKVAQFSFIGLGALLTFTAYGNQITVKNTVAKTTSTYRADATPLDELKKLLKRFTLYPAPHLPRFKGGFVGFVSYEMARYFEPTAFTAINRDTALKQPDAYCIFPHYLVSFNHRTQKMQMHAFVIVDKTLNRRTLQALYRKEMSGLKKLNQRINKKRLPQLSLNTKCRPLKVRSNFTKQSFAKAVRKAQEYIREGDIIQVVLSQQLKADFKGNPFAVYRYLRFLNPSPYMYFLKFGKLTIIGASPEMLVRVDAKNVTTCPIAGTRRRGKDDAEELTLRKELLADEKERAEHIMLVDLARNDLGRIASKGSVRVSRLMDIEKFSHVMHIVSEVEGTLLPDKDMFSAFQSCFPAGTVSGAPKIRAMQIIEELEKQTRGIYAGSIGYFSFAEELDTCITIRTIVLNGQTATIQAGAGIVADSIPEREYEETLNKAQAQLQALTLAQNQPGRAGDH